MNRLNAAGQVDRQFITRRPRCIETDACVYRIGYSAINPSPSLVQAGRKEARQGTGCGGTRLFRGGGAALVVLDGLGVWCAPFFDGGGVAFVLLEAQTVRFAHLRDLFLDVRIPLD